MSWMCIIPFQDDTNLEQDSFLKQFRADWPKLHVQSGFEVNETVASLDVDGATVMFAKMPAPIPDASVPAERKTLLWPNVNSSLSGHKSHWIVTVVGKADGKPLDRARLLTKAVHTFLSTHAAALGVFWGGHGHPVSSATFRELAKKSFRSGEDPFEIWVEFQVGWLPEGMAGGKSAGYTRGLSDLDLKDLETVCAYEPPSDLLDRLHGLAQYLLAKGPVIRDGDTIGHDANEKIRVVYSQSQFGSEKQVMRLDYQPPLGAAPSPTMTSSSPLFPPPSVATSPSVATRPPNSAPPVLPTSPPGAAPLNPWAAAAPGVFGPASFGPSGPTSTGGAPSSPYYNPYSTPTPASAAFGPPPTVVSTSPCAIIGFIAGIVSPFLFCCMLNIPLALLAVVMGHIGLVQVKRGQGRVTGRGLAIAALVLGYLSLVVSIAFFAFVFLSDTSSSSSYSPPKATSSSTWDEEDEIPLPAEPAPAPVAPPTAPTPEIPLPPEIPTNPLNPAPPAPPAPAEPTIPPAPRTPPSEPATPPAAPTAPKPVDDSAKSPRKGRSEPPPLDPQRVVMSVPEMGWPVQSLEFSPDGKWLAVGKLDATWQVYEVATGKKLAEQTKLDQLGQVTSLAWAPDGKTLYTGGWKGAILAWDFQEDGSATRSSKSLKSHAREIKALVVSPDGRFVISADQDGEIIWQQPGQPTKVKSVNTEGRAILALALASPPITAIATNGREIVRIDLREAKILSRQPIGRSGMQSAAFSADGSRILSALGSDFGAIDAESGAAIGKQTLPGDLLWFVRSGRRDDLAVTGGRSCVRIWNSKSLELIEEVGVGDSGYVQTAALSPDGKQVAAIVSSAGQTLRIFHVGAP
ncbi:MAG: DUF4261 domain-containing protein [Pirellulales bacterium]